MFLAGLAVLVIVLSLGLDDVAGVDICTEEGLGEASPCNASLLQHGQPVREGPATHRFMANLASRPLEETGNTQRTLANGRFLLLSSLDQASVLDLLQIASHLSRIGRSSVSALLPSTMLQQHNHQNITYLAYASVQRNHYQHYDDPIQELTARSSFALSNCDSILSNRSLIAQIQHGHFQLLLGDSFDPCAPILAQKLGVPYLAYESGGTLALTQGILTRHSNPLANVPAFGSSLAGETNGCMPFRSRLANVKQHIKLLWWHARTMQPQVSAICRKHRIHRNSYLAGSGSGGPCAPHPALTLLAADWSFIVPRALPPGTVSIGPLSAWPDSAGAEDSTSNSQPLSVDLQIFMDEASDGVIVISLPSSYRLPLRAHMAMAEAVLDLKQRVVWQLALPEHEQLLAAYLPLRHAKHSILVQQHLPMHTILSHPNVHSLVSDGSMQSIHAAIFYAKPLAAVALNAEQRDNVARLTVLGIGRQLERSEIETGLASFRLSIALERLTNVYSYKQRIQTLSVRMHASLPLGATPMQRAAEAIDFVLTMAQAQQQDDAIQARDSAKHVHIGSPDDLLLWMQTVHGAGYAGWMQGHNADVWVLLLSALLACLLGCAFIFHICTRMPAGALAANKDKTD